MKHEQFEALKVGDIVVLRRGLDQGRKAEVVYIEDPYLLIRSVDGKPFLVTNQPPRPLRLTGFSEVNPE